MHLQELFEIYPCLKLLTGDAIYAQRPLLEALQEYHCDWEIENCLHLQKDRYFEEDKHSVRTEWGKVWTVLTNVAVSLAGLLRTSEKTLSEVYE